MRHSRWAGLVSTLMLIGAATAAASAERHRERIDADLHPVGKAADCIQAYNIENTTFPDDRTIDFHMRGGKVYRSNLPQACPNLSFYRAFTHRTTLDQYCSTDTITVLMTGGTPIPGATCGLGAFQPMEKSASGSATAGG